MLQDFLTQVCAELDISPVPKINERKAALFRLGDEEVEIRDLQPGISFHGRICPCPEKKREELFLLLGKANYLGQQTGPARIGMSADEKFLTLSLGIPYEMSKEVFRDQLEDFVNFMIHWRKEVANFEKLETLL
jgi:hypothetical protein